MTLTRSRGARTDIAARSVSLSPALPDFVPPQLSRLVTAPPEGDGWLHEIKYDRYRMHARKLRLLTRTGLDWTAKYPSVAQAVLRRPVTSA